MEILQSVAQSIILALAPVVAGLVTAWLIAKVKTAWGEASARMGRFSYTLTDAASMAVQAAEQAFNAKIIQDKKAYAIQVAQDYLAEYGIKVNLATIEAAIEAAVWTEINREKPTKPEAVGFIPNGGSGIFNDDDD
jgi:hypothetical protein